MVLAGARVPMAAMQPGRIPLYLMHGNVLRVAHPGQCYVEEDEDMVNCGLEFLQVCCLASHRCDSNQFFVDILKMPQQTRPHKQSAKMAVTTSQLSVLLHSCSLPACCPCGRALLVGHCGDMCWNWIVALRRQDCMPNCSNRSKAWIHHSNLLFFFVVFLKATQTFILREQKCIFMWCVAPHRSRLGQEPE
jgi:hypothetical protein